MNPLLVIAISQALFFSSDIIGKYYVVKLGFNLQVFVSWWFFGYMLIRTFATIGQLYAFSQIELGRAITLFALLGIITANVAGLLLFMETYSLPAYIGIFVAATAVLLIAYGR